MSEDKSIDSHAFSDTETTGMNDKNNQWLQRIIWGLVIIAGLYGLYQAITYAWVCDDAFISFRYAKNLIDGNGLVFNVGETVEGYTNFLWTVIIAGAMFIGLEPILFTQVFGIASYICTFLILIYLSLKLSRQSKNKTIMFPLAAMALMLQYDSQVWATSGLETAWVTTLVTLAFAFLIMANSKKTFLLAGFIMIPAVLSRPDAMIFYLMALPYIILHSKKPGSNLIYYILPLLIIYLPYWILRYSYYGYPFPNTYYAKSANISWYSQGFIYFWTYIKTYYALFLLLPAIAWTTPRLFSHFKAEKCLSEKYHRIWLLTILFIIPFIFYVIRVGGDFMFARFFIPIAPISFLILETVLLSINLKAVQRYGIGLIIVSSVLLRWNHFVEEDAIIHGIIDERTYYPTEKIEQAKIDGENIKECTEGLNMVVGFYGAKAMVVYYAEFPVAIECHAGLTDEFIAHQRLKFRRRIGHEKSAPESYMAKRGINFIVIGTDSATADVVGIISFNGTNLPIKYYENRLMDTLKNIPGVEFVDFQKFLDNYITGINNIPTEALIEDFDQFRYYYFDINNDTLRYNIFAKNISARKSLDGK